MVQLPGREFRVSKEVIDEITRGDRQLTIHELEAVKRQGSLVLTYDILRDTDPAAIAGELPPTFPEAVVEYPRAETMTGAQFLTQKDVEIVG